jgi:FdhE protein
MTIKIETKDPGIGGIAEAIDRYRKLFPDCRDAVDLYGAVMEVQQRAICEIDCPADLSSLEVEPALRAGRAILDPFTLPIPLHEFRRIVAEICAVMEEKSSGGFRACHSLLAWEGLSDEGFSRARERILAGERLDAETMDSGVEREDVDVIEGILWESLVPFCRKCACALEDRIDHSLWLRGYCPVCGMAPLMGKFRREDGMWLLECKLCHTLWNVRRAVCPFCLEAGGGSLEYLYLQDDNSRRVQYCGRCKRYIKTTDLREQQTDAVLPFENIVTELRGLDQAAEQLGLEHV